MSDEKTPPGFDHSSPHKPCRIGLQTVLLILTEPAQLQLRAALDHVCDRAYDRWLSPIPRSHRKVLRKRLKHVALKWEPVQSFSICDNNKFERVAENAKKEQKDARQ